jgi:hypothetical protein
MLAPMPRMKTTSLVQRRRKCPDTTQLMTWEVVLECQKNLLAVHMPLKKMICRVYQRSQQSTCSCNAGLWTL